MLPSASFGPGPGLYEPIHGAAPDIAGKGVANPIATHWSAAMMLDFLGEAAAAQALMTAIEELTGEGKVLTRDLGGKAGTREFTDAVLKRLTSQS